MSNLKRQFIPAAAIRQKVAARRRSMNTTTRMSAFAHIVLPSDKNMYPEAYIDAFIASSIGPITIESILRFNALPATQALLRHAQRDLLRRIEVRAAQGQPIGLLSINDVSWVLGVSRSPVDHWRQKGLLAVQMVDEQCFVAPSELVSRCSWVIPTR